MTRTVSASALVALGVALLRAGRLHVHSEACKRATRTFRALRPHFRADFTDALGNVDHTTVDVDLLRGTAFAGVTARLRDRLLLSTQLYVVPADVATLGFGAQYALR